MKIRTTSQAAIAPRWLALAAGTSVLLAAFCASAQTTPAPSTNAAPAATPPKNGVATPDPAIDPAIAKPPPADGATMPVIKPAPATGDDKTVVVPK